MKQQTLFIFLASLLFSCSDGEQRNTSPNNISQNQEEFQPNNLRSRADAKEDALLLIDRLEQQDISVFNTYHFEDLGYKFTVYPRQLDSYSVFGYNDPIDKITCMVAVDKFCQDFGLSTQYSEENLHYSIEKKDSNYVLSCTNLEERDKFLDQLPKDEFNLKYPCKFGDPFEWISEFKELLKSLDLEDSGANKAYTMYSFTLKDQSILYYYPEGKLNDVDEESDKGEWLVEGEYYLYFARGLTR